MGKIESEAERYRTGIPGHFWEIDDYERARILLSALMEGTKPARNVLFRTSELDIIFV
jgi:hypothetical protein